MRAASPTRTNGAGTRTSTKATCERCRVSFTPKPRTKGRFCSVECYRAWWTEHQQGENSRRGLDRLEALRDEGRDPRRTPEATRKRYMAYRATALQVADYDGDDDDQTWAERGNYWQGLADPPKGLPSLWERRRSEPLVLSGHGVRLRIHHGALEIRHGTTHYPQSTRTQLLFPGDRRMPSRIVLLDVDGGVTFDVIEFLTHHDIPLLMLDYRGRPVSTIGGTPPPTDVKLRRAQLHAYDDGRGLRIATDLVREKVRASERTLAGLPTSDRVRHGIRRLSAISMALNDAPADVDDLRMHEARAASAYFAAWLDQPVRWKGTDRRPVPAEWHRMPLRSSLLGTSNRRASHPVNAIQNYAYTVLEAQVRRAILAAGLDPAIGYLHVPSLRRDAFVFDAMEPLRPVVDAAVLGFLRTHTFTSADVMLTDKGVCRLHPQLARVAARLVPEDPAVDAVVAGVVQALASID